MTKQVYWIEKAGGDQIEDVSISDVQQAIQEVSQADHARGAFWMGSDDADAVLEVHADLSIIFISVGEVDKEHKAVLSSWSEVESLFSLFLEGRYMQVLAYVDSSSPR